MMRWEAQSGYAKFGVPVSFRLYPQGYIIGSEPSQLRSQSELRIHLVNGDTINFELEVISENEVHLKLRTGAVWQATLWQPTDLELFVDTNWDLQQDWVVRKRLVDPIQP
jgi:hypothetical protein